MEQPVGTAPRWRTSLLRWLLRTPVLQHLVGRSIALVTFRGRDGERVITSLVPYVRDGDRVVVTAGRPQQWWRDLAAHPDLELRLAGEQHHGRARVLRGLEALDAYLTYRRTLPPVAAAADGELREGTPDPRRARQELEGTVVVGIDLVPLFTRLPLAVSDRG